jgi:hypothetical protein
MLPQTPSRYGMQDRLTNLSIGMGRGLTDQLAGTKQLVTQPVATAQALIEAARQMGTDPRIILEMLRAARQKAMSGALGLGELIGGNVPLGVRGAPVQRMAGPEDFMARREKQLIDEEGAEATSIIKGYEQKSYTDDLNAIMQNKDWLDRTSRRAEAISKLKNLGLPLGVNPGLNNWAPIYENVVKFDDPVRAFNAKEFINRNRATVDQDFDAYISAVREYRQKLNPRSKYDRQTIKDIDAILGDNRVTEMTRK